MDFLKRNLISVTRKSKRGTPGKKEQSEIIPVLTGAGGTVSGHTKGMKTITTMKKDVPDGNEKAPKICLE